ncbi:peptide ABC transporter permease [Pollutimonas nitritireducens]|uniref:Peptide ABC transporter permease n=1 Tax=Pollutimonas nitritireducens TaxID=2045209 RepID=A0A2N4UAQ1_9BURK|nr:ABC transporter permease [Pollutimonas nitritireducens]PLC52083.1 peptide ABC transporter permease [Pollutimonas nitritireducens]
MSTTVNLVGPVDPPQHAPAPTLRAQLRLAVSSVPVMIAVAFLAALAFVALFAPYLGTADPNALNTGQRLKVISAEYWLGSDAYGRDVYSRVLYGARTSLIAGLGAALISVILGLFIGVVSGFFRTADAIIMRVMDGLMAIPGILLAIALVSLSGASLLTVLIAITIPEIPRVVRLVRSVVLTVRHEPYVEAAISLGTPIPRILWRHLVPNTIAPLVVQGTYVFASAILTEAILSFLGAGLGTETSSWGNIMAEGRMYFQLRPGLILYPGILLSLTVLSVNLLGDAMRDALDPRMARKL